MELSIGSYKCRVEILIAIVVIFWIMFGHVLCSCSRISFSEGMELLKKRRKDLQEQIIQLLVLNLLALKHLVIL